MASAAEQLAANINWSAFAKADELKKRIWFTLGALVIYRLGTYIPLPGIDPAAFEGLAPLLTMLNSCAPGVAVVNIDNGYGAGHLAAQIAAPS